MHFHSPSRVLIVIPAYNEEASIAQVIMSLRHQVPHFDRLVVNDGSRDRTGQIVREMGEKLLSLVSNVGYGEALKSGLKYGLLREYDVIVSFDADGQHRAEDVTSVVDALFQMQADLVIGSRFCDGRFYNTPLMRRLGQQLFSYLTKLFIGQRIYDTSSGFKAIRASACQKIIDGTFMDFHTESIVRLSMLDFKIVEHLIVVNERSSGHSMHNFTSAFKYPLKTLLLTLVTAVDVLLARRSLNQRRRQ